MITINIDTEQRQDLVRLTELIQESVTANGTNEGICVVFCPHTTGGITLNSQMDPPTLTDLIDEIDRIVPNSVSIPISSGKISLGSSQGIFFWEFDGPRKRTIHLQIVGS